MADVTRSETDAPPRPLTLQERAESLGLRALRTALGPLGWRRRAALAARAGRLIGPRLGMAERIRANIDLVRPGFDEAARRRIVSGVMTTFARTAAEYDGLPELFAEAARYPVDGLERLLAARDAAGGRMVVVTAHLGNWEAIRAVAALNGAPLAIIYRAFNNRAVDEVSFRLITSTGLPAFHKGRDGARALFRHVREGRGALILVDQRMGGAPLLDFMGRPAETSLAAAQLAQTLKAPLLPAVAVREGDGYRVRFEPAVTPGRPVDMMQTVNDRIGAWVDATPEQWFWLHRRWRSRAVPEGFRKSGSDGGV